MPTIHDDEFGKIVIRKTTTSRQIRIRVAPDGSLRASMPVRTPLLFLKKMIRDSRDELRAMVAEARPIARYYDGQPIGKRHILVFQKGATTRVERKDRTLLVTAPDVSFLSDAEGTARIREVVIKILRREAKEYLPKRLAYIADHMGCSYERVRFSHASSRWGSCSSTGTISLNIALMKLPLELIDYVLVHELAHTKQMNHSKDFWAIVAAYDAAYKEHKQLIGNETPSL